MVAPRRSDRVTSQRILVLGGLLVVAVALSACSATADVYVGRPTEPSQSPTPTSTLKPAAPGNSGVGHTYSVRIGAETRSYRLHLPLAAPPGPRPLVIAFHDGGSSATLFTEESGLDGAGDRGGVIVAYPEGVAGFWNNGLASNVARTNNANDLGLIAALIADVAKKTRLDTTRVTVAGIGDGAVMALRVAAQEPQLIVGAVGIEGGLIDAAGAPRPSAPITVLLTRSTEDPTLPWTGLDSNSINGPQLSAIDTAGAFRQVDRLTKKSTETNRPVTDRDPADGSLTFRTRWLGGARGTSVTLYKIQGAGGAWPGGTGQSAKTRSIGTLTRDFSGANIVIQFALETKKT